MVALNFHLFSVPFVFLCSHTLVNTFLVCCDTSSYQAMILSSPLIRHLHFAVLTHMCMNDPQLVV